MIRLPFSLSPRAVRVGACVNLFAAVLAPLSAAVTIAPLFRDGAVLQRDTPIPVWGRACAGEQVTVQLGTDSARATADADGRWLVRLPARPAQSAASELIVEGENRVVVRDVLVGDVWLCGGQSNMMFAVRNARDAEQEIAAAAFPQLRLFKVAPVFLAEPADTAEGAWRAAAPATVGEFSAVAYFFGRALHRELGVPVGLIVSSYGNTAIATWRSPAALAGDAAVATWWKKQQAGATPPRPHRAPGAGFNGMIAPLVPYAVRGFLWYQGEADASETPLLTPHYAAQFTDLIREWRVLFADGRALPFYWVQLAGYGRAAPRDWTGLREQQSRVLAVPATGQAIALDLGDATDIHPRNKQEVGARLARLALHRDYGRTLVDSGPVATRAEVAAGLVTIHFDSAPLTSQGDLAAAFEFAGADGQFVRADHIEIVDATVRVSAAAVPTPVSVRYGWQDLPPGFLFNSAGLPTAPFLRSLQPDR